ncbi:MAG: SLC13 family permease [Candidatus Omnitrophica bacterium]|nr:SLC13 family permease [Candidatus Omnitrophota bacterium]MDD5574194.1 SLC13 family permease [Candidatus Omnitrophota bacterium]
MKKTILKFTGLFLASAASGFCGYAFGLNSHQAFSLAIFVASIMGTLFFWEFRLSFAFLGSGLLLITKAIDLESFLKLTSLEVILFLAGMMIVVSLLKDAGFFAWLVALILRARNLSGKKFTFLIMAISGLLACAVDEVTSIIFMVAAILEICDYYEVNPMPFIVISVLATNIGSAATVMGNPIGILIATKANFSFEDFLGTAFPIALIALLVTVLIVFRWFRRPIAELDHHIREMQADDVLIKLISIPMDRQLRSSLIIFGLMMVFIVLHRRLELVLGLTENTMLLIMPMLTAGFIMIWKHQKAREYVERGIEWWTLLFFMLLFAQAGTLKHTGATDVFAQLFANFAEHNPGGLLALVLWSSSLGSSVLDNVIIVVTYVPIIKSFFALGYGMEALWWGLLLGGCFGGNITLIGSTANIVAVGLLEKEKNIRVRFRDWIGVGLTVGLVTTVLAWGLLIMKNYCCSFR